MKPSTHISESYYIIMLHILSYMLYASIFMVIFYLLHEIICEILINIKFAGLQTYYLSNPFIMYLFINSFHVCQKSKSS